MSPAWKAAALWALAWAALLLLDDDLDLANKALILVLASALASLWLTPWPALAASAVAVLAFNFAFVPPRGSFNVDLHQHALLLATMLAVSWIVALITARQRQLTLDERRQAHRAEQLRQLGDVLRAAEDPVSQGAMLQGLLQDLCGGPATLLLRAGIDTWLGTANADETAGLSLCAAQTQAMGPGTGRHEEQAAWYLSLRGSAGSHGAALIRLPQPLPIEPTLLQHAQALCDQMGSALERAQALHHATQAREAAQAQALRNTLLAAIAHDHRTPLATILSAASSLHDQSDRLAPAQRQRLAATIVDEAAQLTRLTDNTLQLARLDSPGLALTLDWESVEEIVGTALRRIRQRDPAQRIRARVEADLPLLRCDAVLLVQLLDNLVDNALKYGGETAPVEVVGRRVAGQVVIAVRDRGAGVPAAMKDRIFQSFQRGETDTGRRGAGVGQALCRAIAQAHGGELRLRNRSHGGSAFELWLPVSPTQPQGPST